MQLTDLSEVNNTIVQINKNVYRHPVRVVVKRAQIDVFFDNSFTLFTLGILQYSISILDWRQ